MNKIKLHLILIMLFIPVAALSFPGAVFASGVGEGLEAEVNGYHVTLSFVDEIRTGENEVHVQIVDPQGEYVISTEVEISVMPIEEKGLEASESHNAHGSEPAAEHGTDINTAPGHAAPANEHENMAGMTLDPEPDPESDHDMGNGSHQERIMVRLQPEMESGEYKGILNLEGSGDWKLVIHFSVEGEFLEVEFPVNVTGAISRYSVLAGILGLNIAIVSTAAVLKRKRARNSL